jgi:hypothetical protein
VIAHFTIFVLAIGTMNTTTITIEKKKYRLIPEQEYKAILADIADIKKVLKRKDESAIDADTFFKNLKRSKNAKH